MDKQFNFEYHLKTLYILVLVHVWIGYFVFTYHNHEINVAFGMSCIFTIFYYLSLMGYNLGWSTDENIRSFGHYMDKYISEHGAEKLIKWTDKQTSWNTQMSMVMDCFIDNYEIDNDEK